MVKNITTPPFKKITSLFIGLFITLCFSNFALAQTEPKKEGQIRGFLYDGKTGEPLIYSLVALKGTKFGVSTDVNGYFSLTKIPPGDYTLFATSLGYDTSFQQIKVVADAILTRKILINEKSRETKAVEVNANRSKLARVNTVNLSVTKITPKEIKQIPSVGGEPDIAQYMQVIPGVVFTGDQGGQLYIRGGSPSQNLTLLDGIVIYNPFHSIGLFSIFDTEIIKSADIYTGGFGAEYGGRASAVMDIRTIDGNKNRLSGRFGVNPFTARALIEGPLYKSEEGNATFILSARTSYLDKTSKTFYSYADNEGRGLPFSFTDTYGKVTLSGSSGSKISFSGFNYRDRAALGSVFDFNWRAYGAGTQFILLPQASPVLITGNLAYSGYSIGLSTETTLPRSSDVSGINGGLDFSYIFNKDELKYGVGVVLNNAKFTSSSPTKIKTTLDGANTEISSYVRYKRATNRYILEPGVRMQYYAGLNQFSFEPRVGGKFNLTEKIRLKAGAGIYSQNLISTQSDRDVVALFNGFYTNPDLVYDGNGKKLSNNLQLSRHLVTGVEYDINDRIEITVEPYVKHFNQFININIQKQVAADPDFISETSLAQGIDFLTKYDNNNNLYLQLGYSLAKIERTFGSVSYPPNFDRRHNLNFLGSYKFGKEQSWEFDLRWSYGSGFPFTQTIAFFENLNFNGGIDANIPTQNGQLGVYYGDLTKFNRGRLPDYHRLDASLKKTVKMKGDVKLEIVAGATNIYDRRNLFYYDRINRRRVNQLPILPTLGANFSF